MGVFDVRIACETVGFWIALVDCCADLGDFDFETVHPVGEIVDRIDFAFAVLCSIFLYGLALWSSLGEPVGVVQVFSESGFELSDGFLVSFDELGEVLHGVAECCAGDRLCVFGFFGEHRDAFFTS